MYIFNVAAGVLHRNIKCFYILCSHNTCTCTCMWKFLSSVFVAVINCFKRIENSS